jgi:site-specific recombinase XerD
MDHYFRHDAIRRRIRGGPLNDYLDTFAQQLSEEGYAIDTGQRKLRTVFGLSQWMGRRGLQAHDLNEQVLKRFLADRRCQGRLRHTDPKAVAWFLEHLRQKGVVKRALPPCADSLQRPLERDFEHYLLQERGLAAATIDSYLRVSRTFLSTHFRKGPVDPHQLRPSDVLRFIHRIAKSQPPSSAKCHRWPSGFLALSLRSSFADFGAFRQRSGG